MAGFSEHRGNEASRFALDTGPGIIDGLRADRRGRHPARTAIPYGLLLAGALWTFTAVFYSLGKDLSSESAWSMLLPSLCIACLSLLASTLKRIRWVSLMVAFALLGTSLGLAHTMTVKGQSQACIGQEGQWTFELLEDPKPTAFGQNALASASQGTHHSKATLFFEADEQLYKGAVLTGKAHLKEAEGEQADHLWSKGAMAKASVKDFSWQAPPGLRGIIYALRDRAIRACADFGGASEGLLAALACGHRPPLNEGGLYEDFKTCGLAHIVAVSGAHLSIVIALLVYLLRALHLGRVPIVVVSGLFVSFYLLFAGIPLSAIRASIMVILGMLAPLVRRRSASLSALGLSIIGFIAFDPASAISPSLFLTCASTLGIILFAPLISSWFSCAARPGLRLITEPFALTLSANIATLPYSMALFSQMPVLSLFANVLVAPLFSLSCITALGAAFLASLGIAGAETIMGIAALLVQPLIGMTKGLAALPFASIAVHVPLIPMLLASLILSLALWLLWPTWSAKGALSAMGTLMALIALGFFANTLDPSTQLTMLDVGQGDSFLLRSKGVSLLIDTGNQDTKLRDEIGKAHLYQIDCVVITHPDDDHCGSLLSLSHYAQVKSIAVAADLLRCPCEKCADLKKTAVSIVGEEGIWGLSVGDHLRLGALDCEVLWPRSFSEEGGNEDSLCLLVTTSPSSEGAKGLSALFTGDAESDQLEYLAEEGRLPDIDILKVGHHGSATALTEELIERLSPSIALIGVGEHNRYGHPDQGTLDVLKNAQVDIYRSDVDGTVTIGLGEGLQTSP